MTFSRQSGAAKLREQSQSIAAADRIDLLRTKAERAHPVHSVADRNIWVVAAEQNLRSGNEISECRKGRPKGGSCDIVVEAPQLMLHAVRCVCGEVRRTVMSDAAGHHRQGASGMCEDELDIWIAAQCAGDQEIDDRAGRILRDLG